MVFVMHEMALTQSILNIALTEAARHGAIRVYEIRIIAGVLSGFLPELIQEYFNIISADTVAEKAFLSIEKSPVTIMCLACGAKCLSERFIFSCPTCSSTNIHLLGGREFYVDSIEVE